MASIRKKPNSKFWYVCYCIPGRGRVQKSTGIEDRLTAMQIANSIQKAVDAASGKLLTQEKAKRIVNEISLFASESSVFSLLNPLDLVGNFITSITPTSSAGQIKSFHAFKLELKDFFGDNKAHKPASSLVEHDAVDFRSWLDAKGFSISTVNKRITFFKRVWAFGVRLAVVDKNIWAGMAHPKRRSTVRKPFTMDQFRRLLKSTDGDWRTLILIAGLTGQRLNDCRLLKWEQVDFNRGVIVFSRSKNKDLLEVPMHPVLEAELKSIAGLDEAPVLPDLSKAPQTGKSSCSDVFRMEILPRIGIKQPYIKRSGEGRAPSEYTFHSLRHSFNTWLNEAGVSDVDRAMLTGHRSMEINRGYTHTNLSNAKLAVAKVLF